MWLAYTIYREAWLMSYRECAEFHINKDPVRAWALCHAEPGENVIPFMTGC